MQRILRIDLTTSTHRIEELDERVVNEYIGGRGLGAYLLYKDCPKGLDPMDPSNPLIFSAGPAQGVGAPYSGKASLTTKSPLTGIYLACVTSGSMGQSIKNAGLSSVVVTGRAARPTYLVIVGDKVEFRPAERLWGTKVGEAQQMMLDETGLSGASTLGIGPAGEKGIKIACISTEGDKYRAFGRGGAGCVMGSKNLKGVLVDKGRRKAAARKEELASLKGAVAGFIKANPVWSQRWMDYGTGNDLPMLSKLGLLPTNNWQAGSFDGHERIDTSTTPIFEADPRKLRPCGPNCPNPCSHYAQLRSGPYAGAKARGPEYETIYSFGSNCGVDRMDAIVACAQICDEMGLDTISTGVAVGFGMECFERGLISKKDTDGIELRFGNHEAMVAMVNNIANRKGLGELLGEGTRRASRQIPGSESFAMHTKGLELGGYEARASNGQALAYALCSIGGSHGRMALPARIDTPQGNGGKTEGKGQLLRGMAIDRVLYDSAIACVFGIPAINRQYVRNLLQATMGGEWSDGELEKVGLRVTALERMFNMREGIGRAQDTLPRRLLEEPMASGPTQGRTVDLEPLKDDGYAALGWGQDGFPTAQTLTELNLSI
ncbi:MAG: aldehyde ferredoxin oxidoreductase family protein [Dehalococcoidia bacterium]|nr:aldehyde ferredoxin oxidoreductase family protein [Dehalococcoidia bacterium]